MRRALIVAMAMAFASCNGEAQIAGPMRAVPIDPMPVPAPVPPAIPLPAIPITTPMLPLPPAPATYARAGRCYSAGAARRGKERARRRQQLCMLRDGR